MRDVVQKPARRPTTSPMTTTTMKTSSFRRPLGIGLFGNCFIFKSAKRKRTFHRYLVFLLTFLAYASFHMGRRPLTIVKNVLSPDETTVGITAPSIHEPHNIQVATGAMESPGHHQENNKASQAEWPILNEMGQRHADAAPDTTTLSPTTSVEMAKHHDRPEPWAPFDNKATADKLLAILDSTFLTSYAVFMFFSGMIGERSDLRYFTTFGAVASGLCLIALGFAKPLEIHWMSYFVIIQVLAGAFQSFGWPAVVTCMGNWFPAGKRGLVYGFWNAHTNLGNILGAALAGFFVEKDWALSFMVPGLVMLATGALMFLFLAPSPQHVGLSADEQASINTLDLEAPTNDKRSQNSRATIEEKPQAASQQDNSDTAVSFWTALMIPGVIEYSLCLFFSKLINYTFLYWLPRYITTATHHDSEQSAYLSTPFDVGGVCGAILIGYLADLLQTNAILCQFMLLLAIPTILAYEQYGARSSLHNIGLQFLVGSMVNGPYCLITTSVSADLGSRVPDGKAMATVAAIIDGMGSLGAVIGPLVAGFISTADDWSGVFNMLLLASVLASLSLLRATMIETKSKYLKTAKVYYVA